MERSHLLAFVAAALFVAGGVTVLEAQAELAAARAQEAACRAQKDGLAQLSCMDFTGIGAGIQTAVGIGIALGGVGPAAAALWLVASGGRRPPSGTGLAAAACAAMAVALLVAMEATGVVYSLVLGGAIALGGAALALGLVAIDGAAGRAA